jgi:hypothetical protein
MKIAPLLQYLNQVDVVQMLLMKISHMDLLTAAADSASSLPYATNKHQMFDHRAYQDGSHSET